MFGYSLESLGRQFQRVDAAALGQLDLEAVFTLRLRVTQDGFMLFSLKESCRI